MSNRYQLDEALIKDIHLAMDNATRQLPNDVSIWEVTDRPLTVTIHPDPEKMGRPLVAVTFDLRHRVTGFSR